MDQLNRDLLGFIELFEEEGIELPAPSSISRQRSESRSHVKEDTRQLLGRFDEPDAYEFPKEFDYETLEKRAAIVDRRLNEELGERTTFENALHNQDASFSVAVCLNGHERSDDQRLYLPCVRFSNFGNLVTVTCPELVPSERLKSIIQILKAEGFTFVPQDELDCPYDGVMTGKFESWWIRYFDWL
jgi:hypothetical protein